MPRFLGLFMVNNLKFLAVFLITIKKRLINNICAVYWALN